MPERERTIRAMLEAWRSAPKFRVHLVGDPACFRCEKPATGWRSVSGGLASGIPDNMQPVCDDHDPLQLKSPYEALAYVVGQLDGAREQLQAATDLLADAETREQMATAELERVLERVARLRQEFRELVDRQTLHVPAGRYPALVALAREDGGARDTGTHPVVQ